MVEDPLAAGLPPHQSPTTDIESEGSPVPSDIADAPVPPSAREGALPATPAFAPPTGRPVRRGHTRAWRFSAALTAGVVSLVLVTALVAQLVDANAVLRAELAGRQSQVDSANQRAAALQVALEDLRSRWFGYPALFAPPPIANTTIRYFTVTGTSQQEILDSFTATDVCKRYGPCSVDPAVPSGITLGLEWFAAAVKYYSCASPATTTIPFREYVLLPRWSPPADGTVRIDLVEKWNAFAQAIYVHEAGHAAIDRQDLAALNAKAHRLSTCSAVFAFWSNRHVYDKELADQNAYHARLHADCRPEIGCMPAGWMGW